MSELSTENDVFKIIHERWMGKRNRKQESESYKDEWYSQQCFMCKYFIYLSGRMGGDYGACSNPRSDYDGCVRFEHDGCDGFTESEES